MGGRQQVENDWSSPNSENLEKTFQVKYHYSCLNFEHHRALLMLTLSRKIHKQYLQN